MIENFNFSHLHRSRGMIALILVIWTTIGLSAILYSLTLSYESILSRIKVEQRRAQVRSAGLLCKDIMLWRLADDARFVPSVEAVMSANGGFVYKISDRLDCVVENFTSTSGQDGAVYFERKIFTSIGRYSFREYNSVAGSNSGGFSTSTLKDLFRVTAKISGFPKNTFEIESIEELSESL